MDAKPKIIRAKPALVRKSAAAGDVEALREGLLGLGAKAAANVVDSMGRNALTKACIAPKNQGLCVRILTEAGARVDLADDMGQVALHWASRFGREEAVSALLAAGADPNAQMQKDLRPLHLSLASNTIGVVRLLLDAGADPLAENIRGESFASQTRGFDPQAPLDKAPSPEKISFMAAALAYLERFELGQASDPGHAVKTKRAGL